MAIAAGAGIAAVGSVASGAMSSSGAKNAANTQADASQYAADLQQKQFDQVRQDLSPYMGAGQSGLMALLGMLGLPASSATAVPTGSQKTAQQLREELLPQFTTSSTTPSASSSFFDSLGPFADFIPGAQYEAGRTTSTVDEVGLQKAIDAALAQQSQGGYLSADQLAAYNSPLSAMGRLLQTPFSFDASDLENTPGYQFTLSQGLKSLANQNAARGLGLSGAQQKGALEYATGLADNTYGQQYQRALQQYTTNYGLANDMYSRLMGLATMGQNSAAGVGNMGMQAAGNIGNLVSQGANAQAASQIAGSNAWGNAIGNIGNAGALYGLMQQSFGGGVPGSTIYAANQTSDPIGTLWGSGALGR